MSGPGRTRFAAKHREASQCVTPRRLMKVTEAADGPSVPVRVTPRFVVKGGVGPENPQPQRNGQEVGGGLMVGVIRREVSIAEQVYVAQLVRHGRDEMHRLGEV